MISIDIMMISKDISKKSEKIGTSRLLLTINNNILEKLKRKSKKLGYISVQQYVYDIIRRDINRKKVGGRPNEILKAANVLSMKHPLSTKGKPFKI